MTYTVEYAFDEFFNAINLSGDHRKIANDRKESIVSILRKNFDIIEAFGAGSIPKFTALKGHADLDIIVALHYSKHIKDKTPKEVLQNVRDVLADAKYQVNVRKNGQAVTMYYSTWPSVDIVPVSRNVDSQNNITHYNVPDANTNNWIKSRPKSHAINIENKASECGENFRRIIKMVKWWNLYHGDYLQSYHIEVMALKIFNGNLDDTPWEIYQFFKEAQKLLRSLLWHDVNYTDDYLTYEARQEVLKRFDTAVKLSNDAWFEAYSKKDYKKAITLWKQLFGEKFPAYG